MALKQRTCKPVAPTNLTRTTAVSDADTSQLQLNIYMERKPRLTTEGHFPQNIDMS